MLVFTKNTYCQTYGAAEGTVQKSSVLSYPSNIVINSDTTYLGGNITSICTWSGIMCPSILYRHNRWFTVSVESFLNSLKALTEKGTLFGGSPFFYMESLPSFPQTEKQEKGSRLLTSQNSGGAEENWTLGLLNAIQALSQLSYNPVALFLLPEQSAYVKQKNMNS